MEITPVQISVYLLGVNGLAFLLYGLDKHAARKGHWRVAEVRLHMAMLIGGTIGAFVAQRIFRHKNCKPAFQMVFWLLFILQIVGLMISVHYII